MEPSPTFQTLPARYYTDPVIFRDEMERFYFDSWICAGRDDVIPKTRRLFLARGGRRERHRRARFRGKVRCFYNVCRHRGTRICSSPRGNFNGRMQCPYHGWRYALDGRLLGAPIWTIRASAAKIILLPKYQPRLGMATYSCTSA